MPAAKLFGEPSRLSQNVGHCKCMFLFWNGKRKAETFFEVSAFYRAFQLCSQYFLRSTPVLPRKYYSTFREVLRYWLRSTGEGDYYSPFRDFNNSSFASLCISAFNTS